MISGQEYIWDFHTFKEQKNFLKKYDDQAFELDDLKEKLDLNTDKDIQILADTQIHKDMKKMLDFTYEMEKYESEIRTETYEYKSKKNEVFFYMSVPSEVISLEVYSGQKLIGYSFFPMANMNFGQNHYEEIYSIIPDTPQVLGDLVARLNFYPSGLQPNLAVMGKLGSLDFDDITQRFSTTSGLYEACFLIENNIKEAKKLIWKGNIRNFLKD